MSKQTDSKLLIFALGGVGEIGKNMYVLEYADDIIVIDAGLKHPEEDMLGIDIVIPDISYLEQNKERIRGFVITHGHEDHIGALPYILKQIKAPVFATKLTMALIEEELRDNNVPLQQVKRVLIHPKSKIKLGCFTLTFFRTNHSIPDSVGICIDTPEGRVVHSGDFKFDYTPLNGEHADIGRMAEIGEQGVLVLLSDSTNAEIPGYNRSEREVGRAIADHFFKAKGRIIVSTLPTNIHRIQNVFEAAVMTGRKVAIIGKNMARMVKIAQQHGYLRSPEGLVIDTGELNRLPARKVCILSSEVQGEELRALSRMARPTYKQLDIQPGDTVIFAETPVPGHEKLVSRIIDQLFRAGAHVVYGMEGVHVSGHGHQEELKLMLNLIKPKYFIPIHGEYRMLRQHGKLAEATGIPAENIFLIENGDVIEFQRGKAAYGPKVHAGQILIDGLGVGDVGNIVLRDRKLLSQDGIFIVVVTLSKQNGSVISGPDIISRGFVYVRESEELMDEAVQLVSATLKRCQEEANHDWSTLKSTVREALSRFLYDQTRRRPMILPIIMEA